MYTVFDALGSSGDADLIMELYRELRLRANIEDKRLKLKPDSHTCANIVKALTACGRSDQALTVFDTMRQENVPLGMPYTQSYMYTSCMNENFLYVTVLPS
jgi:pentatricopeptide repeat protein